MVREGKDAYIDIFRDLDSTHCDGWKMRLGAYKGKVNGDSGRQSIADEGRKYKQVELLT